MSNFRVNNFSMVLNGALSIRTEVYKLIDLSEEMTLVAYNAEIASTRVGDYGRAFRVMTKEIGSMASDMKKNVNIVCDRIRAWTQEIAVAANNMRKQEYLVEAASKISRQKENENNHVAFGALRICADQLEQESLAILETSPATLVEVNKILEQMRSLISFAGAVRINLIVEKEIVASKVESTLKKQVEVINTLAESIQITCDKMTDILNGCLMLMAQVSTAVVESRKKKQ